MRFVWIAFVFLVGCSTTTSTKKVSLPTPETSTPQAEKELLTSQNELKKNPVLALKKLEALVQKYPNTVISSAAAKSAGDYYFGQKKLPQALNAYSYIVYNNLLDPNEFEVLMRSAQISSELGDLQRARNIVNTGLKIGNLPIEQRLDLLRTKLELEKGLLSKEEQLLILSEIHSSTNQVQLKTTTLLRANAISDSITNPEELNRVLNNSRLSFVQPGIHYRLGVVAFERGDAALARDHFSKVISLAGQSELSESARDYLEQLDSRSSVDSRTVGVILPLSGKFSDIGRSVLNSIQLGLGIYDRKSSIRLAIIDSEGKSLDARRAVERLVVEDKVIAIIGSLQSKTASTISARAQALGIPTIVLSQKSGITDIGDFIFRNALTSEMQVDHIVKTSIEKLGITRFAMLYPDDAYGNEYASLFWESVKKYGGQINAAQTYNPKETDFRAPIQKIVGTYYADDRMIEYKSRLEEWKKKFPTKSARNELPDDLLLPIVNFQALFIPDSTRALGQISAMLAFQDIKGISLLGTNIWNTSSVIDRAGPYSDKIVFVDSFLSTDEEFLRSQFVQKYFQLFKKYPTLFDLQAYDTAVILREALDKSSSRSSLQSELKKISVNGALSSISTTEQRNFTRPVIALTVKNGQIIRLDTSKK